MNGLARPLAVAFALAWPLVVLSQGVVPIKSKTLENGLEIIVVQNATIPFVTLDMVFRAGAFTQTTEDQLGLPHLIEHMLFRRGEGSQSFDDEAGKIEASWNGVTDTESVQYYLTFPEKHLQKGMELLSNLIRKPTFNKQILDAERPIVRGELERRASEPSSLLRMESDMMLWDGPGFGTKNPGGNIVALTAATPERLNELYKRFYVPNNAALVVAGNVSESVVFALADRVFRGWKRGPDPLATLTPPPIQPLPQIKRKITTGEVKDVTLMLRWHGPSVTKDPAATYAADVFAGLVNQPLSGTQKRLVDAGVVESVVFRYVTLKHVGPLELIVRTTSDRAVAAIEAVGAELAMLTRPDYFSDDDMVLAKKLQRVGAQFRLESASATAFTLADFWASAGMDYYVNYDRNMEAQTRADVDRFLATYFKGKPMVVNVLVSSEAWGPIATAVQRAVGEWRAP
ncbi:MAG: M16 family metallopeptidase [Gemmatimonadaceae bacterium]